MSVLEIRLLVLMDRWLVFTGGIYVQMVSIYRCFSRADGLCVVFTDRWQVFTGCL